MKSPPPRKRPFAIPSRPEGHQRLKKIIKIPNIRALKKDMGDEAEFVNNLRDGVLQMAQYINKKGGQTGTGVSSLFDEQTGTGVFDDIKAFAANVARKVVKESTKALAKTVGAFIPGVSEKDVKGVLKEASKFTNKFTGFDMAGIAEARGDTKLAKELRRKNKENEEEMWRD